MLIKEYLDTVCEQIRFEKAHYFVKKELKENFYHGMLLGLLKAEGSWITKSNAESGIEYTDITLTVPSVKIGCIIEVKYA